MDRSLLQDNRHRSNCGRFKLVSVVLTTAAGCLAGAWFWWMVNQINADPGGGLLDSQAWPLSSPLVAALAVGLPCGLSKLLINERRWRQYWQLADSLGLEYCPTAKADAPLRVLRGSRSTNALVGKFQGREVMVVHQRYGGFFSFYGLTYILYRLPGASRSPLELHRSPEHVPNQYGYHGFKITPPADILSAEDQALIDQFNRYYLICQRPYQDQVTDVASVDSAKAITVDLVKTLDKHPGWSFELNQDYVAFWDMQGIANNEIENCLVETSAIMDQLEMPMQPTPQFEVNGQNPPPTPVYAGADDTVFLHLLMLILFILGC